MALECTYCGARTSDDAARCPQCLRATGLIPANDPAPRRPLASRRARIAASVAAIVVLSTLGGTYTVLSRLRSERARSLREGTASVVDEVPPPFARTDALRWLVASARSGDALARARAALDALRARLRDRAHVAPVLIEDGLPPARTIEELATALDNRGSRFTSLDLCRVLYSALEQGGARPRFARRALGSRPDVPADPTGALGRYVVLVGEHGIDPLDAIVVPQRETRPTELTPAEVTGAMLIQSALAAMLRDERARASALLTRAVERWPDAGLAHAARAIVTRSGLGGAVDEGVLRDLATAVVASGGDPAVHLLRARAAVVREDFVQARTDARAARNAARGWGDAALAAALAFDPASAAGAGRCDTLIDAREPWTDDALVACRALTAAGAAPAESVAAAHRLARAERDPMRLALAAAALGEVPSAADAQTAREMAGWLALAGRDELARQALTLPDSGR